MAKPSVGWLSRRYELFLAFRYLKARRRQAFTSVVSVVSVLGVTVGVAALIIALALLTGFQNDIQGKIIGANGHVFVQKLGAGEIEAPDEMIRRVQARPDVVAAAPAVHATGLIEGATGQPSFVNLKGIDPRAEARTTELLDRMVEGSAEGLVAKPSGDRPGIIVGRDLADQIFVRVGDVAKVTIYAPGMVTPWGAGGVRTDLFEVVGVFEAGMYEYDSSWALITVSDAQRMLEIDGGVSIIQVRVEDVFATEPVVTGLREELGDEYFVIDWQQMNRAYFAALKLEKLALFVTISLIVMVAALNIVATLVLMIKDKQRDIGILMALGATRREVLHVFLVQGLVIGLIGTLVGCVLGVTTALVLDTYELIRLEEQVYYLSFVPFEVQVWDFLRVCVLAVIVSFAATIYPAWRASRLDPVISLRYE